MSLSCTAPANDRRVVGDSPHRFRRLPGVAVAAFRIGHDIDVAAEAYVVHHLATWKFPGVAEGEPFVGIFLLPAIGDDLAEQSEVVADAVAQRGNAQRRHAFHEARGKPAQAAVAECCVRLAFAQLVEVDAKVAERGVEYRQQSHIVERVGEQPSDQELERQIIDALAAGVIVVLIGRQPAMHDAVA